MSRFEKVTLKRWIEDSGIKGLSEAELAEWYEDIKLPQQATAASAGCDFFMPFNLNFEPHSKFKIATGIRWVTDVIDCGAGAAKADASKTEAVAGSRVDDASAASDASKADANCAATSAVADLNSAAAGDTPTDLGKVLLLVPRSGLGFKYGIKLSNTVGVIDADYCGSDNEGHIIVSLENPSDQTVQLPAGKPFCQGIVVRYEIPEGAESDKSRNGGFGSTDGGK